MYQGKYRHTNNTGFPTLPTCRNCILMRRSLSSGVALLELVYLESLSACGTCMPIVLSDVNLHLMERDRYCFYSLSSILTLELSIGS